jgi:ketosteroid isomerase-like protein
MKHSVLVLSLACCIPEAALATEPKNASVPAPADAKQQVLALGKEWVAAEVKHDAATLHRILHDKFLASFGGGKPYNKAAFIRAITEGAVDPTASQTLTEESVIVDHDTAVVVGIDTVRETEKGVLSTVVYRYTVTYVYRHGSWLALAEHLAEVPPAK